jgi:hypothetical protein
MDLRVAELVFRSGGVRSAAGDDLKLLFVCEIQLNRCTISAADCDESSFPLWIG